MTVTNDGTVPKICADCDDSYWEEMCLGEAAFCGRYSKTCDDAIKECDRIMIMKCEDCPRCR